MNQSGKHAAETGRLENKRERRRGAAGRAAVLRRAPSDSDCSGETASLSADSGDRALRPAPLAPPRSGKTRSRRRGSEWEVLEGLKDGQRFEKRPDVFNGYLHKKRKWPLKGWHKRFFVIDGGILVYARSPTDVARGRLHGSVDVGLSVISAKARRRRIDIDADEFIYHLRAKTPDVFRTWLNILKVHRLYRQHLLTFGARESVPKIHPPLDHLPATDTSSHTSFTSENSTSIVDNSNTEPPGLLPNTACNIESSVYSHKNKNSILDWQRDTKSKNSLIPLNFEDFEENNIFNIKHDDALGPQNRSMCSMKCMARIIDDKIKMLQCIDDLKNKQSPNNSKNTTDAEKQMTATDLDSLKTMKQQLGTTDNDKIIEKSVNSGKGENALTVPNNSSSNYSAGSKRNRKLIHNHEMPGKKPYPCLHSNKKGTATACYFFGRKKNQVLVTEPLMKKSRKCTNLVKYKNVSAEPSLKNQSSKCMLLGKRHLTVLKHAGDEKAKHKMQIATNEEVQVKMDIQENKALQNVTTTAEYDKITEKLMISIFRQNSGKVADDVKHYIDEIVKDLYDIRVDQEMHPVKALFRNLLEYWLKNTSIGQFKAAMTSDKAVDRQSIKQFSKDVNLSSYFIRMTSKETQFRGVNPAPEQNKANRYAKTTRQKGNIKYEKVPSTFQNSKRDTESFEKERRIQELERLLRNTVYVCETTRNSFNKEKDIKITKKLINNLGNGTKNTEINTTNEKQVIEESSSSAEIPDIQETINHLISETSIPADIAKEFLGAYLELLQESSKSTTTSQFSDWEKQSHELPVCEVEAESVIKKVSKSIATCAWDYPRKDNVPVKYAAIDDTETQLDPGQIYLKDILDKVTTIFSKVKKIENCSWVQDKAKEIQPTLESKVQTKMRNELGKPVFNFSKKDLIYENCDENALVIDLSKYDLEYVSMFNDPEINGVMSITVKLKEKHLNYGEPKPTHLGLKISEDSKPMVSNVNNSGNWLPFIRADVSSSNDIFRQLTLDSNKVTYLGFETNRNNIVLKPNLNTSGGTSKAHRPLNESLNSLDQPDISTTAHTNYNRNSIGDKRENEDLQSCYLMSIKKAALASNFLSKKKCQVRGCGCNGVTLKSSEHTSSKAPPAKKSVECSAYEKPAPRIIDERFILLLLENLTYLSRNVPTLHRDINTLYMKLKKKHEKVVKCFNNIQGLSLLGKIYSEDPGSKDSDDRGTQYDPKENQDNHKAQKDCKDTSTNTDVINIEEKCACTTTKNVHVNSEVQATEGIDGSGIKASNNNKVETDESNIKMKTGQPKASHTDRMTVTQTETIDIDSTDQSTSVSFLNSLECKYTTMRCAVTENSSNIPLRPTRAIRLERDGLKKKRNSPRMKQELIKEISLLSPSFKVSTQSQTDRQLLRLGMNKRLEKDFNVYQLYFSSICGVKVSSSMTIASGFDADMNDELKTLYRCTSEPSNCSGLLSPTTPTIRGPQAGFVSGTPGGRLAGWIIESGGPLESASRELGQAQLSVQQLQRLLDALELQHQLHHDTDVSIEGASPNVKKDRRKFGLRKKKSNSKCASVELAPPHIDPSSSHTALSSLSALTAPPSPGGGASSMPNSAASLPIACAAARPQSLPGAESLNAAQGPASLTSLTPDHQLREDFTILAKDLVGSLKGIVSSLVCERGRLRAALEAAEAAPGGAVVAALRTNLSEALRQNSELRSRLSRIHDTSDIAELLSLATSEAVNRQFQQSLSYSSSCVSGSEFFDAEEHEEDDLKPEEVIVADEAGVIELDGDSSSEAGSLSSEEGSASSDNSDGAMLSAEQETLRLADEEAGGGGAPGRGGGAPAGWARRVRLAAPRPAPGGPSLWNLLYKNIGKDLSQISMPVTINEPLNMLQRLCEELEYSELLDAAAAAASRAERMALVAAFAVSAYAASAHRAASKPFNPLLGETYECVRDDRGFRFLAEQVSHHPPISACHAESPRWCFWQEARIKTKFWGKSMEFQPTGRVHVRLNRTGDHYTWNKVTTCVHNLFGGQRWVDQYGDMHIVCVGTDISCKLNFIKASSWSHTRHEVRGAVASPSAGTRLRLAGRWSEALYAGEPPAARCLWRPGAMPPEHEMYYGFTRFAMELNEMEPGMREVLPHTDTRFRPDQRALEEGDVEAAEAFKHELEQAQRERRRGSAAHVPAWFRKTVEDGEETWVFSGEYWKAREAGFSDAVPRIW